MVQIATPPGEAQAPFQINPNVPVTSRLPIRELTGSWRKRYEPPLRRSSQFIADMEAEPMPAVGAAALHDLRQQYCERFGAIPPWVLAQTHAEQLQVIADAMRNDRGLDGALVNVHTPSQALELQSLGEPSSPVSALQRQYAERFGTVPFWVFQCAASEQRALLNEALAENCSLGGELAPEEVNK